MCWPISKYQNQLNENFHLQHFRKFLPTRGVGYLSVYVGVGVLYVPVREGRPQGRLGSHP